MKEPPGQRQTALTTAVSRFTDDGEVQRLAGEFDGRRAVLVGQSDASAAARIVAASLQR